MKTVKKLKKRVYRKTGGIPYCYLYPRVIPIGYYINRNARSDKFFVGSAEEFLFIESPTLP